jgi:ribosomal protein S27AE
MPKIVEWDCIVCAHRNDPTVFDNDVLNDFARLKCGKCGHVEYVDTTKPAPTDAIWR